ncbi:hypothetical protein VM98_11735 [Streptomyces rubellomurinus subsp. indigoferus]|nr:hypothetical protein VM98_11735 [Streptomyces rubellomurinus subsp. indigoferus]
MKKRLVSVALGAAGLLMAMAPGAVAAPAADAPSAQSCEGVTLTGSLPVPPAGTTVQQTVTIGPDCKPQEGPVSYVPTAQGAQTAQARTARAAKALAAAGDTTVAGHRKVTSASEMYDCCNIRMTGLYTTSDWDVANGRITTAATTATQGFNREPWNAGWSVASATNSDDCTTDCAVTNSQARADFSYKGIFDPTGLWYGNTHTTSVTLNPDLTYSCTFDVQLRHTFIGWNWQRSCKTA